MGKEKESAGWELTRRQFLCGVSALVVIAFTAVMGLSYRAAARAKAPEETSQAGNVAAVKIEAGCQLVQTMRYTPCGHETTRRLEAPEELVGKERAQVEAAYDQWRVTGFAAKEVQMEQQLSIHCPMHVVLMPDEAGVLSIFENKYGDALAFVRSLDTPLHSLPEAVQEELRTGKGFDSLQELEQWFESVES